MFYCGAVKYQEVDGQLQRHHATCNQRQILDQQAVAQELDFRGKNLPVHAQCQTHLETVFEREGSKRQLSLVLKSCISHREDELVGSVVPP